MSDKIAATLPEDHLFIIVLGGTFPSQYARAIQRSTGAPYSEKALQSPGTAVFETEAHYPDGYWETPEADRPMVFPHSPRFAVSSEIIIGTIKEILAHFEKGMRQAVAAILQPGLEQASWVSGINPENQQKLRELRDSERAASGDPTSLIVRFDHNGHCARDKALREKLLADQAGKPPAGN